jgi:hypothetical protein
MKKFDTGEAIRFGWTTVKANLGLFIVLTIILWIVSGGSNRLTHTWPGGSGGLISWILTTILSIGLIRITLKFVDGGTGTFNDLFSDFSPLLNYLLGSLLYGLIVVGGLVLLIVPGIVWAIKFGFYGYFIVDEKAGVMDALRKSSELTRNIKGDLLVFYLAIIGINLLGAICLGVGLLVSQPTAMLAMGYVYRKLQRAIVAEPVIAAAPPPPIAS